MGLLALARIATIQGQWDEARQHALKAVTVFRDLNDLLTLNLAYSQLGDLELRAENLISAQQYHLQCILASQDMGQRAFVAHELESFAFIAQANDQPARAARLLGATEALQEGIGTTAFGIKRLEIEYENALTWLHTQLDETAFNSHWSEGCALSMDRAVAYALQPFSTPG